MEKTKQKLESQFAEFRELCTNPNTKGFALLMCDNDETVERKNQLECRRLEPRQFAFERHPCVLMGHRKRRTAMCVF